MPDNRPSAAEKLRQLAEMKLRLKPRPPETHRAGHEAQRLIHELQVHQIELEMQNEELRRSQAEIEKLKDSYFDFYDFSPAGFISLKPNGAIAQINLTGAGFLNSERASLIGQLFSSFAAPASRTTFDLFKQRAFSGERECACELELIASNQRSLPVQVKAALSSDEQELRVVITDLTAMKNEELERKNLLQQVFQSRKMKALGTLAGGVAHNFNNNLAIILGNIELAKLNLKRDSAAIPFIDAADTAVHRARDLVQRILTYSHANTPKQVPLPLSSVIDETLTLLRSTVPATIQFIKNFTPTAIDTNILADPSQIQEVLINLCNNAVQAMEGKGELTISLKAVDLPQSEIPDPFEGQPGRYAKLSIQDTGSGMTKETLEQVFDPFFTTRGVNQGTGLGLATVHGIVTQHNGLIKVESTPGEGSTFELYFPIVEAPSQQVTPPAAKELPTGHERILFLDDEEMLADVGQSMLKRLGYQATSFTSSKKVLELFQATPQMFDLVISDQTMPEMSGRELLIELLKIRPGLPTILFSGYSRQINEKEVKALGIKAFCLKPLNLSELAQVVRAVLDGAGG
jgi:signal transduction histidine kinase/ActR/RegA family two-component response regulator